MYDRAAFGGNVNPYISTSLETYKGDGGGFDMAVMIFEYQDFDLLGKKLSDGNTKYICDKEAIDLGLCGETHEGMFLSNTGDGKNKSEILSYKLSEVGDGGIKYMVKHTGYYCAVVYDEYEANFDVTVNFRNSFGNLAAAEFPKLALYAALAIAYALAFFYYGFSFYRHRNSILPLQKYISAFFIFLILESVMVWGYYDLTNRKGTADAGVKVYMVFVSIMQSIKFTFSFFLLLVIALGYGIVYPKLDRKLMLKCRIFAGVHLFFCLLYIITNYLAAPGAADEGSWVGLLSLPVVITTGIFYVTTLKSLGATTALLASQKQQIKLDMYRKLFRIIFVSLLVLILGIIVSSFIFIGMSTTELIEQHWKSRFFFLDFWPSLVYFVIFNLIAFLWRPTEYSYMLAASSQLPTDPENAADFELDDLQSLQDGSTGGYHNVAGDDADSLNLGSDDEDNETSSGNSTRQPPKPTAKKH
ncbi:CYFA0S01e02762g1_1 [Cyberlindnera fabianii]|uniref:CYFA0S01e02762g1_1 n=1 Tax=Cyberlindnera fabianii TaxID=36022 RepID=A0A061AGC2_CYBFA|nr:CYFA0S01e02762g1_1 [Cyberlindnera fabianii]